MPRKKCIEPGCEKIAQGKSNKCKAHNVSVKCNEPECTKSAIRNNEKMYSTWWWVSL
jgi:hypothetical protein